MTSEISAQSKLEFNGQASAWSSYSPDNQMSLMMGGRYIPELLYGLGSDSVRSLKLEASANIYGSMLAHPFDSTNFSGNVQPYRIWARYAGKQYEIRVGLQKIDFGSSTLLRPLQWFTQIDPRDPLRLTNGVYGALGRYYFLNNANIWMWVLYGNERARGFDIVENNKKTPEFGTRIQYPVPKGEIAISYHHRTADSRTLPLLPAFDKIAEDRFGIDGKWDVTIGLWFEASYTRKTRNLGMLTHQTLINPGADYTFGIGNGLNVITEHMLMTFDETSFQFQNTTNITAATLSYPLAMFDNLSTIGYYNWTSNDFTVLLNYEHRFKRITSYVMAYYNPDTQQGIQQNNFVNNFKGPGLRLMLVYNH